MGIVIEQADTTRNVSDYYTKTIFSKRDGSTHLSAFFFIVCNYDGGDCCSETCKDGTYKCKSKNMDCIDPYAGGLPLTQSLTTSTFSNVSLTSTDTNITSMVPTYSNTTSVPGSMYMYYEGEILSNSTEDYSITSMNETYAYIYNQTR